MVLPKDKVTQCVSENENNYTKLTNWSDGGNHAYRRPCIGGASGVGEITISHGGLYIFYDHLAVCRCTPDFRQRVVHRPARTGQRPRPLLEDRRSAPPDGSPRGGEGCAGEPAFASDLFGLVRLEDGDSVWIEARPASAIHRPNGASFFGLYRLQ